MFSDYHMVVQPGRMAILRLSDRLQLAGVPFDLETKMGGWHIYYPCIGNKCVCSVIEFPGSYGYEEDLLEIMGLLTEEEGDCDDVAGFLSVDDVFERIYKHWEANNEG